MVMRMIGSGKRYWPTSVSRTRPTDFRQYDPLTPVPCRPLGVRRVHRRDYSVQSVFVKRLRSDILSTLSGSDGFQRLGTIDVHIVHP